MITYVVGDLFYSPARALVNPVNTVGVMGQGVAYDFKRFYPEMFAQYRALCQEDALDVGRLMLYRTAHKWVLNFPTKRHFRAKSRPKHIEAGLKKFVETYAEKGITSVSFPRLGAGNGKLNWDEDVRPLMEAYLGPLPISVYIHHYDAEDDFAPERRNVRAIRSWLNNQPQVIPYDKFRRDLLRLLKGESRFQTFDDKTAFTVKPDAKGRGLTITPSGGESHYIASSSLTDLWQYIRGAGYALPVNLPGGLDALAPYVVALLANLKYVRPVRLATMGGAQQVGLHFVPPSDKSADENANRAKVNPA